MASNLQSAGVPAAGGSCPLLAGYDPLDPAELRDPYPSFARAQRDAPVFYDEKYSFWSVTRHEDVLAVTRDTERFSSRMAVPMPLPPEEVRGRMPVYPGARSVLLMDNPEHHPARKMLQAPFTPSRLREMESVIRAHAERLLRSAGPDRHLEFVHEFAMPLALAVIGGIMGVPEKDFPLLEDAVASAFRVASRSYGEDEELPLARAQLKYWEYLQALVEERRAAPRRDFASVLASYVNDDGSTPSREEVASQLSAILSAGFETSAQMMSFGVRSMIENRDQWDLLRSDRSLLPQAVEECVRHRTLIKRIFRLAVADVEIGGVLIPEGSLVGVTLGAANHDASVFAEPERFDITRSRGNLAFGNGTHFCLGAPLAKLEMRITLETLLDLAPGIELVASEEIDYVPHMIVYGMVAMPVDLGPDPIGDLPPGGSPV